MSPSLVPGQEFLHPLPHALTDHCTCNKYAYGVEDRSQDTGSGSLSQYKVFHGYLLMMFSTVFGVQALQGV